MELVTSLIGGSGLIVMLALVAYSGRVAIQAPDPALRRDAFRVLKIALTVVGPVTAAALGAKVLPML